VEKITEKLFIADANLWTTSPIPYSVKKPVYKKIKARPLDAELPT
jgi:hypothetical protein